MGAWRCPADKQRSPVERKHVPLRQNSGHVRSAQRSSKSDDDEHYDDDDDHDDDDDDEDDDDGDTMVMM
eukprot:16291-Karenia_brevis.AAC.1